MQTEDGFEVTLEENDLSFAIDSLILRVSKTIKYGESQMIPRELAEDSSFVKGLLDQIKDRINDKVNCV